MDTSDDDSRYSRDGEDRDDEYDSSDDSSFADSMYDVSEDDDDKLYEDNIDEGVEWVGSCNTKDQSKEKNKRPWFGQTTNDVDYGKDIEVSDSDSETDSDEDLNSLDSSSDDNEGGKTHQKFKRFRAYVDMDDPKFVVGMLFSCSEELKQAIKAHGVKHSRDVKFLKNDNDRVKAKCNGKRCSWFLCAPHVKENDAFQIRSLCTKHNCGNALNHKLLTSKQLSRMYLNDIRLNMNWSVSDFQTKVHNDLRVNISRKQVYRTFDKARTMIEGQYKDQYKKLHDYCEEIRRTNPGSTVALDTVYDEETGEERFLRLYVCLEACRRGLLEGCRPVLGLDGCHLKGPHPGVILTAVGIDGNNCIYPVVYCIAETEDKRSWSWFLNLLVQDLEIVDQERWIIITDKQKGLCPAVNEILPHVEHRHCVRHLYNNFKKLHGAISFKDLLWKAAKAPYVQQFENIMRELKEADQGAYDWLANEPPRFWCRSHFRALTKCDLLMNNLCESFNAAILDARDKSIIVMLEKLRIYLMKRIESKREWIRNYGSDICPKIRKLMNQKKVESAPWMATFSGDKKFQVRSFGTEQYVVDLDELTCSCRRWDLSGIPCAHAVTALTYIGLEPEDYVAHCYKKEAYMRAYEHVIYPINGPDMWPATGLSLILYSNYYKLGTFEHYTS